MSAPTDPVVETSAAGPLPADVIDVHAHHVSRALIEEVERNGPEYGARMERLPDGKERLTFDGLRETRPFYPELFHVHERDAYLERTGVDMQVVSSWADLAGYHLPVRQGAAWARLQNDTLATSAASRPTRLRAMGSLPMQDMPSALAEMRYAVDSLGMRSFEICTNVNGRDLDHDDFRAFWKLACDLDVLVFLHPPLRPIGADRLGEYFLSNLVGNPTETSVAGARLIFSGLFQELPDVKILLAHGGGMLPYQIGRFDQGYRANPAASVHLRRSPIEFLSSFYYDTILFDDRALAHLFRMVPADHILFGSDCPFPIRDDHMLQRLGRLQDVSDADLKQVLAGNATRLLVD